MVEDEKAEVVREYLEGHNYEFEEIEEFMHEYYQNMASVKINIKNFKEWVKM
jgi:hypothetical protein